MRSAIARERTTSVSATGSRGSRSPCARPRTCSTRRGGCAAGVEGALRELGVLGEVDGMACDVSDPGDVERLVEAAERFLGGIDVLANNAGVAWQGPVLDLTRETR